MRKHLITLDPNESEENLINCWNCEEKIYHAIKNGQIHNIRKTIGTFRSLSIRKLYPENSIRNKKDLSLFSLALCVRASVHGGLPIPTAFALEAYYTAQIEKARDLKTISSLNIDLFVDFAERVHDLKLKNANHSSFLIDVEEYVTINIEEELSLEKIASEFDYAPYYLSKKYKAEKGTSLLSFIKQEKMNHACFLLKNSNASVTEIAEKLHFINVSHFTCEFKKYIHTTPTNYRNNHKNFIIL